MLPDILASDPLQSAVAAGLRYVRDNVPGIRRIGCGHGFRYVGPNGRPVRDRAELQRIRSLVIPPAWRDVWICASPFGHLQAVGWDARGRKQYRYHPLYRDVRDQAKFGRMIAFGAVLAVIRKCIRKDMARPGLPREKVIAAVVRLLETTFIRVGNDEYARENDSFGLTTLRNKHVEVSGAKLRFRFRGKSGLDHEITLTERRLAHIVERCQDLPGYDLFEYRDENGAICRVDSCDVNRYLREVTGQEFTAKDFRTWAGTVLAAREFRAAGPCASKTAAKKNIVTAIKRVAKQLGNRPATCRKYYVHPAILEAYGDGSLFTVLEQGEQQHAAYGSDGLLPEEFCVLVLIAEYQAKQVKAARQLIRERRADSGTGKRHHGTARAESISYPAALSA